MRKIILIVLFLGTLLIGITGCGSQKDITIDQKRDYNEDMKNCPVHELWENIEKIKNLADEGNLFAIKLLEEYKKIDYDNKSDLEKTFLRCYIIFLYEYYGENTVSYTVIPESIKIKNIWAINYKDNEVDNQDNEYSSILINLDFKNTGTVLKNELWNFIVRRKKDSDDSSNEIYANARECKSGADVAYVLSSKGIEENKASGIIATDSYKFEAPPLTFWDRIDFSYMYYEKLDLDYINSIIEKNNDFIDLFIEYRDKVEQPNRVNKWKEYEEEQKQEEAKKPKAPAIGMTKTQVKNSTWGEPDKINKDTYSWGTTEQWVYDDKGYIYFKNGIVTSISER